MGSWYVVGCGLQLAVRYRVPAELKPVGAVRNRLHRCCPLLHRGVERPGVSEAVRPVEVADRVIVWVQRVSASRYFLRVCEPVIDRVR